MRALSLPAASITRRAAACVLATALVGTGVAVVAATAGPAGAADAPDAAGYTWSNVEIVGGGFVPGIVFNQGEKDLVYARTDIGGAYRLDKTTKRWIPLLDHIGWDDWSRTGVLSLATDARNPDRVY
ncbi:xyloglucanase, partial [Cellulomonas gelida]